MKEPLRLADAFGGADHEVMVNNPAVAQFVSRVRKVAKERRKWARKGNVACYRIYDADLPEYSAAIDLYVRLNSFCETDERGVIHVPALSSLSLEDMVANTFAHVAEYAPPKTVDAQVAEERIEDVLAVLPVALGIPENQVYAKVRKHDKGGAQYAENRTPFTFTTSETGLAFKVDMNGYLDTGLFLDHRVTRELVQRLAKGKRFLNLFSYTGSATVHAAAGGARATMTVDLSSTYLEWAHDNMVRNGFDGKNHFYARGDTMQWLRDAAKKGYQFDLAFVDPPTFSNSKAMGRSTWDVQRDHVELLRLTNALLSPGGAIVFSCNRRNFKLDVDALERLGLVIRDVTPQTIPEDFKRNPKIHKCFVLQSKGAAQARGNA